MAEELKQAVVPAFDIVGRSFGSTTTAVKEDNGDWTVAVVMSETRTIAGKPTETQEVRAQCTHKSFEYAYGIAMNSTLEQFNDRITETKCNSLFYANQ